MLNSLIFLISLIILFILFLLVKKSSFKLNLIKWILITLVLLFCFNSFVVYILSYIHIKTNLLILSIIYNIISLLIYIFLVKNNKQKYYFHLNDVIVLIIAFILIAIIAVIRFGIPFSITYKTLDPSIHFQSSYSFYKESILLNFVSNKTIFNFETWRFGSYTNLGIIFKFFSPFILENNFYNIYILFDIFTLYITALLFYYLVNNGTNKIIILVGTILFVLGYPLNNLLIGFFYIGHASCIIMVILMVIQELKCENINFYLLFLLNIGLTFTYYLFIPFVFLAEFIYFIKSKKIILKYSIIFGIPIIFGFIYFVLPTINNSNMNLIHQTKLDGYFYNDVISNSLLFFPIIICYFYRKIKEKNIDFEFVMTICVFFIIILLNILALFEVILPYYISKYYYILWIMCFTILFRCYNNYYKQVKVEFNIYLVFMLGTIILSITNIENSLINLNEGEWNKTTSTSLFNVYKYNLDSIINQNVIFTAEELKEIKRLDLNNENTFVTNAEIEQTLWLINFIEKNPIDCPVNQTYECIKKNYNMDINEYLKKIYSNNFNKTYIFLSRDMYPYSIGYTYVNKINVVETIDGRYNNVEHYKFGFVIRR